MSFTLYSTKTTCVQVLVFNPCQPTSTIMILYYNTHTGCITALVLYHCMTCTVHRGGWCCSCLHLLHFYCFSCLYIPTCTLTFSICCAFLISRHATSAVVFLICCVWMERVITSSCLCALIECVRQSVL